MKHEFKAAEVKEALNELLNLQVIAIEYSHGERAEDAMNGYKAAYASFVAEVDTFDGITKEEPMESELIETIEKLMGQITSAPASELMKAAAWLLPHAEDGHPKWAFARFMRGFLLNRADEMNERSRP